MTDGMLTEIDHVAIAVIDLEAAIAWYREVFGATVAHRERVESDGVEEALLAVADSYVQLLTPITRRLPGGQVPGQQGRGTSPHRVPGRRLRRRAPVGQGRRRPGDRRGPTPGLTRGTTVAFVHPKTSFGTLIELVEGVASRRRGGTAA